MQKTISTTSQQVQIPNLSLLWIAISVEGIVALIGLLRIPSDTDAAVWMGFSLFRLVLAGFVLVLVLLGLGLSLVSQKQPQWWKRTIEPFLKWIASWEHAYLTFTGLFAGFFAFLFFLLLLISQADMKGSLLQILYARAGILILWVDLIFLQVGGTLAFLFTREGIFDKVRVGGFRSTRLQALFVIVIFLIGVTLKAYLSAMGIESDGLNSVSAVMLVSTSFWVAIHLIHNQEATWAINIWSGILFLGGAIAWGWFINWGDGLFTFHDWSVITAPRLAYLQDAIRQGTLPLHISNTSALNYLTDRFLGIPDVLLSPQILVIAWSSISTFVLVNLLLLYSAGFAGLVVFARRRHLSLPAFTILFLLFNFNGHILAHIGVGHYTWTAYFLFPWLINLLFDLLEGQTGWKWVMKISILMLVIFLQGGYHQFVYSLIFLGFLALVVPRQFWTIVKAMVFSVLLSAVRLLPVAITSIDYGGGMGFKAGYATVGAFFDSLTQVIKPIIRYNSDGLAGTIGTWEITTYIGFLGSLFLVIFGIAMVYKNRQQPKTHAVLLIPALGSILLSFEQVYRFLVQTLAFPPFTGERVSNRLVILGILVILALAVVEFQKWYEKQHHSGVFMWIWAGGVALLVHDLYQNAHVWQVLKLTTRFKVDSFNPSIWTVVNRVDPVYTLSLAFGAVISIISLVVLIYFNHNQKQKNTRSA